MGWIKHTLPEPDEYNEMAQKAWEDAHFEWWHQQDQDEKFIEEKSNGTSED